MLAMLAMGFASSHGKMKTVLRTVFLSLRG
jgi:hypothetical protein